MDQLRDFMRVFKRVHFWVLLTLSLLIGLGVWFMAKGKLDNEREQFVAKIVASAKKPPLVTRTLPHPNEKTIEGMNGLILATQTEIAAAWELKEKQQISILTWPEGLGGAFISKVQGLRPIERQDFDDSKNVLPSFRLEGYADYIGTELPNLATTIGAVWQMNISGDDRQRLVEEAVVDWKQASQEKIVKNHFQWSAAAKGKKRPPTTIEVLYAQEDLWVLSALMNVIKQTNSDATGKQAASRFRAAVKSIEDISIGAAAAQGQVQVLAIGRDANDTGAQPARGEKKKSQSPDQNTGPDPADGRYVDNKYQPLSGSKLRSVMTSDQIQPEDAYLAVAKRIPVRMKVSIDQRKIEKFLVECANSKLTVEVRDLLLTEQNQNQKAGKRRGGGGGGFKRQPERDSGESNLAENTNQYPFDVVVEIYGIVYLYNPVDRKALGIANQASQSTDPS